MVTIRHYAIQGMTTIRHYAELQSRLYVTIRPELCQLYVIMRNWKMDYTSLCGIAKWTIRDYAELQNGLYVIMRNCKMDYTSLCGIAKWTIRYNVELQDGLCVTMRFMQRRP